MHNKEIFEGNIKGIMITTIMGDVQIALYMQNIHNCSKEATELIPEA